MSDKNQSGSRSGTNHKCLRCMSYWQSGILPLAFALVLLGATCRADVIFTNLALPPNPSNALPYAQPIRGGNPGESVAQSFIPTQNYTLASVSIALSSADGTGSFSVAIMTTDSGTGGPGTILEQFDVTSVPVEQSPVVPIVLVSVAHPTLVAGTTYWLAVIAAAGTSDGTWQSNLTGDTAASAGSSQVDIAPSPGGFGGPWYGGQLDGEPRGAFEVSGSPSSGSTTPSINSIAPTTAVVGGPDFTLIVNGTNFVSGSTVQWSGLNLPTTFVSAVQLTAVVAASLIAYPATNAVSVANPDGTSSSASYFTTTTTPKVTVTGLSPSSAVAGGANLDLTIAGTNFSAGATVHFGNTALTPALMSTTQILVTVPAALIATAGTVNVSVVQISGTSNASTFTILPSSTLAISGLSPSSALAGGAAFTLTINGANFASGATVHFGSTPLTPTSLTPTQILVTVPSTLIATAGTVSVNVVQSSSTSNAATFTVTSTSTTSPAVIDSMYPGFSFAGGAGFQLTINGSGFTSDSTVQFGTSKLTPSSVSSTQIVVSVPSTLVISAGNPNVNVVQSSGTSNAIPFNIFFVPGQPLSIGTAMALPAGTARAAYSTTLVAGGGTPPYVWTLVSSSPQSWLSLSATGEITGTPTAAVAVLFTAKVTDGASASVSKDFLVVIADPNSPVAITTDGTLPPGTVGLAYSEALVATGDTPPYVWSLSSGVLPAGLSLSSAGVISGTPTAAETDRFTIQVAARGVVSSSLPFSLTISAPVPDQSGVFAHLVSGGGWKTSLYLINASVSTVPVVVKFRDDTGSALSLPLTTTLAGGTQTANAPSVSETIAPGATLLIESDSQASVSVTGWAEVISAGPLTGY